MVDQVLRVTEIGPQSLRRASREQSVPLVGHTGENGRYDERPESCPEPVFICTDSMGMGHLGASLPLLILVPALRCHKKYPRGGGPVPVLPQGCRGRRTTAR
jgi:hypothetical protein